MRREPARIASVMFALACSPSLPAADGAQSGSSSVEIALVANAQAGTVALLDVASRSVLGTIDINPARAKARALARPNYAQDTDVSPDGRTLYVSRGYLGDVAAFDIASGRLLWQRSLNTGRADHMTLTPDGRSLFVSALMDNRVYKVASATGEITGHRGHWRLSARQQDLARWPPALQHQHRPARQLPRTAGAPPLTETPGYPFQLTIADVGTLKIRDRIRLDNRHPPMAIHAGRKGPLRAAVESSMQW